MKRRGLMGQQTPGLISRKHNINGKAETSHTCTRKCSWNEKSELNLWTGKTKMFNFAVISASITALFCVCSCTSNHLAAIMRGLVCTDCCWAAVWLWIQTDNLTSVATCVLHHHWVTEWLCLIDHLTEVVVPSWKMPMHTNTKQTSTHTQTERCETHK